MLVTMGHGTGAGYQRHRRAGETPCQECRAARAAYIREYRTRHPHFVVEQRENVAAHGRALTRLKTRHREEFTRLYKEEKRKLEEVT